MCFLSSTGSVINQQQHTWFSKIAFIHDFSMHVCLPSKLLITIHVIWNCINQITSTITIQLLCMALAIDTMDWDGKVHTLWTPTKWHIRICISHSCHRRIVKNSASVGRQSTLVIKQVGACMVRRPSSQ